MVHSYPTDEGKPLLVGCLLIPGAGNHLCHSYEILIQTRITKGSTTMRGKTDRKQSVPKVLKRISPDHLLITQRKLSLSLRGLVTAKVQCWELSNSDLTWPLNERLSNIGHPPTNIFLKMFNLNLKKTLDLISSL